MGHGNFCAKHGYHTERDCPECAELAEARATLSGPDLCIDCDGLGKYPAGHACKSCGGSGRVMAGDGVPMTTAH